VIDGVITRADANYWQSWRVLDGNAPGGELVERNGVFLASSALPIAWLNLAIIMTKLPDPESAIVRAIAFFDERKLPFVVRIRQGLDAAAEEICTSRGLPHRDTVPGLVMEPIVEPPPLPQGLAIRAAHDAASMDEHRRIMASSFGFPQDIAERLLSERLLSERDCEYYIGYVEGGAVASSALIMTDGVAGVYNVGCLQEARRKGYGEAMTWHAVTRGKEMGCDIASLQASEMGRPIYERMGFRLVAPYKTFVRPEW
jgi:GNAT superfamily N-acetyltransferase